MLALLVSSRENKLTDIQNHKTEHETENDTGNYGCNPCKDTNR